MPLSFPYHEICLHLAQLLADGGHVELHHSLRGPLLEGRGLGGRQKVLHASSLTASHKAQGLHVTMQSSKQGWRTWLRQVDTICRMKVSHGCTCRSVQGLGNGDSHSIHVLWLLYFTDLHLDVPPGLVVVLAIIPQPGFPQAVPLGLPAPILVGGMHHKGGHVLALHAEMVFR